MQLSCMQTSFLIMPTLYHPRKGKIRVMFDCSAKYCGTSLNDHVLKGPDLNISLVGVLCHFQKHPVTFSCDPEKMFFQFKVPKEDQDYLCFLGWPNGQMDAEPPQYHMTVHLFGPTSLPSCANDGLKFLAKKNTDSKPEGSFFMSKVLMMVSSVFHPWKMQSSCHVMLGRSVVQVACTYISFLQISGTS